MHQTKARAEIYAVRKNAIVLGLFCLEYLFLFEKADFLKENTWTLKVKSCKKTLNQTKTQGEQGN